MDKKKLIEGLNSDLAAEVAAIVQYLQHSYLVMGLCRKPVIDTLREIAKQEMEHAELLAERIVALEGVPTVKPAEIRQADTIEKNISFDIAAEKKAMDDYARRIKEAEEIGEWGTSYMLQNILLEEQNHWDEFTKLLRK
jgi:bacterioferritin